MTGDGGERYKKVSSAAKNMSALVDDIAKTARRNFKDKGVPEVDAKFLKDSVGALKELFEMEDTVGKVSALSGGYGSSYAATAGMQSYSNELSKLNSVALDLRDRAYSVYKDKGDALYDAASLLRSLDGDDYKKYRDTVSDYYSDGDYLYKKLKNMSDSEYEKFLDEVKAWENDRKFSYEQYIDETERQQYEEGMAFKREEAKRQQANADRNYALALKKLYSSGSSGGSSKKPSSKKSSSGDSKADYPRTYSEFVKETGKSNIMTEKEFSLRENAIKSYGDYESYLKKMYAKYKD